MRFLLCVIGTVALFSLCACSAVTQNGIAASESEDANTFNYVCDNGETLRVDIVKTNASNSATLYYRQQRFDMYETRAASGAKYATEQGLTPEDGLIWWSQKNTGMLINMIKDDSVAASDYPIITTCKSA